MILTTLSGCGFHLRQQMGELGSNVKEINLDFKHYRPFHQELISGLKAAGVNIVTAPTDAKIIISDVSYTKQIVAYAPSGEPSRQKLMYQVDYTYTLKDRDPISNHVELTKERNLDSNQILGDDHQLKLYERLLAHDMALQLLYQIART